MASRTKSFFEQDSRSKSKPSQWHRHHHNRPPLADTNPNATLNPPIPAGPQTKAKLKAFQFAPGHPTAPPRLQEDTKENVEDGHVSGDRAEYDVEATERNTSTSMVHPAPDAGVSGALNTPSLPHANTFPCTPSARLTLEDLIGNCDQWKDVEPTSETPDEQIGWVPNSSSDLLTPNRNRKRKRARSSSPSCPSTTNRTHQASALLTATPSQLEKTTPEADPVADLWRQYGNGKYSIESLKLPDLIHPMQASPRAPFETPIKAGSFRRWASTGNDWPSSKNKRRCIANRPNANVLQDPAVAESNGKSKVAAMIQSIQKTLATQKLVQEQNPASVVEPSAAVSSSSPLLETSNRSFDSTVSVSPLQARQQNPEQSAIAQAGKVQVLDQGPKPKLNYRQHLAPISKAPLPAFKRPSIVRAPSQPGVQQERPVGSHAVPGPKIAVPSEDLDGIEDDAWDFTADDLEELLPQTSTKSTQSNLQPDTTPPKDPLVDQAKNTDRYMNVETTPVDDDDEFACGDLDEASFVQAEFTATQGQNERISPCQAPRKKWSPRKSQASQTALYGGTNNSLRAMRFTVTQVVDGDYTHDNGRRYPETLLLAEGKQTSSVTAITLRDSWVATPVVAGSTVHVAHLHHSRNAEPTVSPPGQIVVDDSPQSPLLILHPDHMLSATTVADSFDCLRKAVLQDRIKATGETNKSMVYGKILHEVFQQALSANRWEELFLTELVERTVQNHVEGLWELGMRDANLAVEEVRAKMGELSAWAQVFVGSTPGDDNLVDDQQGNSVALRINKLIAIEEHIWSPRFGLKGNVDATVQISFAPSGRFGAKGAPAPMETKQLIMPLEVKTGRTTQSAAHRAQTALYTLLSSDRYDIPIDAGILYYLESSTMSRVAPPEREVRQMVQQRNRLAGSIHRARHPKPPQGDVDESEAQRAQAQRLIEKEPREIEESGLPGLLRNPHKCGKCYARDSCFTYHALAENGTEGSAGMLDDGKKQHSLVWQETIGHLALTDKSNASRAEKAKHWFAKWDRLLTFEESEASRFRKELWTMSSKTREEVGRCFGNLIVTRDLTTTAISGQTVSTMLVDGIEGSGGKINRFAYAFGRSSKSGNSCAGSFTEGSQLTVGEPIVVSSESGQWALANGYIISITRSEIKVAVDRKLGRARQRLAGFHEENNQVFRGTMAVAADEMDVVDDEKPMLYRLDKDEFSNGLALIRNNLVTLMSPHPMHTKLREHIVYGESSPSFTAPTSTAETKIRPTQLGSMNEDQQAAVSKVLAADDYALILGMPGTGKTTTIAHIIRALLAGEKSVLLTSFTHTAVDNILLKIRDIVPPGSVLRLGVPAKINGQVQEFCQLAATPRKTVEEVETAYMQTRIVATTCMGTNHAIFQRRTFDVCIVDEASQITLPTILGTLLKARKFVLVGDHFQLPPLIQNRHALEGGMDVSLFRQLSETHPESVAELGRQYRMCDEIMSLSNALIYEGRLRCGNDEVANRTLSIPASEGALDRFHTRTSTCRQRAGGSCWLELLTAPERKVVFANTDQLGKAAQETLTSGKNITNEAEATLAAQLVLNLLALGVRAADIGIITLYRSQLSLIRQLFKKVNIPREVEIDSADRFQGRDKECIILSMVRSNEAGIVGDLLKDWRRVNVALTRARSKLIVLGGVRTLRRNELLAKFVDLLDENGWRVDLPPGTIESHGFDFSTQMTLSEAAARSSPPTRTKKRVIDADMAESESLAALGISTDDFIALSRMSSSPMEKTTMSPKVKTGLSERKGSTDARAAQGARVITGKRSSQASKVSKRLKEQVVFEIFED